MAGTATHQIAVLGAIGRGHLTMDQLAEHLPMTRHAISKAACRLITRGMLDRVETGEYRLTASGERTLADGIALKSGPSGPRPGVSRVRRDSFRQRAWAAMRLQKRFEAASIVAIAARADDTDPGSNLGRFIRRLVATGYVVELPARKRGAALTSPGFKVYHLLRDTGPTAPADHRSGGLFDRNTGEAAPCIAR